MFKKLKEKIEDMKESFYKRLIHRKCSKYGMEEALNRTPDDFVDFIVTESFYANDMANDLIYGRTKSRKKIELVLLYGKFFSSLGLAVETHKKRYFKDAVVQYNDIKELKQIIK